MKYIVFRTDTGWYCSSEGSEIVGFGTSPDAAIYDYEKKENFEFQDSLMYGLKRVGCIA